MDTKTLETVAKKLVAPHKGILAADESFPTIAKRFQPLGIENSEENRRAYRDMLFTTQGAEQYISGVILFDETLRQKSADGTPFPKLLESRGIAPGIKVDQGTVPLTNSPKEKRTEGLDGLPTRLKEYAGLGARFAKWRAVITIGEGIPSDYCLRENARLLGTYAAMCQEAGIVPIVEPEVLMDGAHSLERCYEVTERTLQQVFLALHEHGVHLEGMLLKPNMVISGKEASRKAGAEEVARETVRCFRRTVPAAVPGIVFLSGGQGDEEATANLNAINALGALPWQVSFSYGRALQAPAIKSWKGDKAQVGAGQRAFFHRAKMNGLARSGAWKPELEKELAKV